MFGFRERSNAPTPFSLIQTQSSQNGVKPPYSKPSPPALSVLSRSPYNLLRRRAEPRDSTMLFTIECPECGRSLRLPETAAGKQVRCPACEVVFVGEVDGVADVVEPV